jgi:ectoine hydroxylase-related dioxygenase (phytanoyl-CoA dioxygenase family)
MPDMSLTEAQSALLPGDRDIEFYEEHGWWISPPIVTPDEIEDARFGVDRYYSGERDARLLLEVGTDWTEARGDVLRQNDYVSLQIEELRRLAHHPVVAATAARLARTSRVRLYHDQLISKPPRESLADTAVGWHTDIAYWKTCSSRNLITAWIPFQPVTADMGAMMVLDRSHSWSGNDRLEYFHESDLDAIATRVQSHGAKLEPVPFLMDLGQVSYHHCRTIHGSRPNHSSSARLALAVHMQDEANHYVAATDENGKRLSHINDFLCRKDATGNPDYFDPEVCPVLWEEAR